MSVHEFKAESIRGGEVSLADYNGKVLLIVNTASQCGLTPQYEGLQRLYDTYEDEGLVVLGFPCNQFKEQEPGTADAIEQFCKANYGVTFPLFAKVEVLGEEAHPLFKYLTSRGPAEDFDIKWNFAKFLVGRDGSVVKRFEPQVTPDELEEELKAELAKTKQ